MEKGRMGRPERKWEEEALGEHAEDEDGWQSL